MLTLFGHDTSPYVRRVRVLLQELGLPFVRDPASWGAPSEALRQINPMMRVPALLDSDYGEGGLALLDSRLIATYLYDQYGDQHGQHGAAEIGPAAPLLQRTLFRPESRYQDENLLLAIDAATDSLINVFLLELDGVTKEAAPYLRRQEERAHRSLAYVETAYGGYPTLAEGRLSYVDIALCCSLDWMRFRKRYDITQHPGLLRVLEALAERPALAESHPSRAASTALPNLTAR